MNPYSEAVQWAEAVKVAWSSEQQRMCVCVCGGGCIESSANCKSHFFLSIFNHREIWYEHAATPLLRFESCAAPNFVTTWSKTFFPILRQWMVSLPSCHHFAHRDTHLYFYSLKFCHHCLCLPCCLHVALWIYTFTLRSSVTTLYTSVVCNHSLPCNFIVRWYTEICLLGHQ